MEKHLINKILGKLSGKKSFTLAVSSLVISLIPTVQVFALQLATAFSTGRSGGGGGGDDGGISEALCTVVSWFSGPVGGAIASLAVIFLGIAAFFGKVTWGLALLFTAGIFAIFGAQDIIYAVIPNASGC